MLESVKFDEIEILIFYFTKIKNLNTKHIYIK